MSEQHRSGFVALAGRPNVGKSTLVNRLVGRKIAIVSDKPQTTRTRIQGVLTRGDAQVILVDTPGLHRPLHRLGEYMVRTAQRTLEEVDAVLFVVDAQAGVRNADRFIAEQVLAGLGVPVILAMNKIDRVPGDAVPSLLEAFAALGTFERAIAVSAADGTHVPELLDAVVALLPEGPKLYPDDWVSDHPEQFLIAEVIREKVLHLTHDEVPHAVAVVVEELSRREDGLLEVQATIYVERETQKAILIGKGGQMLKEIGQRARLELEALLGSRVYLGLWVKVKKDWREREGVLRSFGYTLVE